MYKKTVTYEDYNGVERTEDFYFNFTKAELMEMEMSTAGGLTAIADSIVKAKDGPAIIALFKDLLLKAYGVKDPEGRRFIKSKELSEEFSQSPAYSIIFMELAMDDVAGAEFVNGIIPSDLAKELAKKEKENVNKS